MRASLATAGAVRLSEFGSLPETTFAELLQLLAAGLDAPIDADGARRALSIDGQVEVVLRDPALTPAMLEAGVAIFEEEVRSELLDSISDPSASFDGRAIR